MKHVFKVALYCIFSTFFSIVAYGDDMNSYDPPKTPALHEKKYPCDNGNFSELHDLMHTWQEGMPNNNYQIKETVCTYDVEYGYIMRAILVWSMGEPEFQTFTYFSAWINQDHEINVSVDPNINNLFKLSN